jgi:hypothetical protein
VTITRVGKNQKYADGWAAAFGSGKSGEKNASAGAAKKKASPKKAAKKAKK